MPNAVDLATLLAQTPHVAKVKTAAVAQGEASKSELARQARQKQLRKRATVAKAEKANAVQRRQEEGRDEGEHEPGHGMHNLHRDAPEEGAAENNSCGSDHGSVCGQIINRRV